MLLGSCQTLEPLLFFVHCSGSGLELFLMHLWGAAGCNAPNVKVLTCALSFAATPVASVTLSGAQSERR